MSRKAKKISVEEFTNLFYKAAMQNEEYNFEGEVISIDNTIHSFVDGERIFIKDISKIKFDFENIITDDEHCGVIQIGDLTFLGAKAGGDWEYPVYFVVYWDGKNFRGYIPEEGNTFNTLTRTAFGSEGESEKEIVLDKIPTDKLLEAFYLKPSDVNLTMIDKSNVETTIEYLSEMLYEKSFDLVEINWDLIQKDIVDRIKVEG